MRSNTNVFYVVSKLDHRSLEYWAVLQSVCGTFFAKRKWSFILSMEIHRTQCALFRSTTSSLLRYPQKKKKTEMFFNLFVVCSSSLSKCENFSK